MFNEIWNLRSARLFDDLTQEEIDDIMERMTTRSYRRGEFLFYTGEIADCLFLLLEGAVKVSYITMNGEEKILNLFQAGDLFGELFLGNNPLRIGEAQALEDSIVCKITEPAFLKLIQIYPRVAVNFIRHLVDEQRAIMARMHALMRMEAKYRLLGTLLGLARRYCCPDGEWFTLHESLTQEDLANMTGLNRSTVSLLINDFRRQDVLGGAGRSLMVNRDAVEQILHDAGIDILK